ncbi:tRNA-dihydrouridine synthase, partial [Klebsiella quasipneumoniae]
MHGNLKMIETNQTSAIPDNPGNHWSGRFSVAPML